MKQKPQPAAPKLYSAERENRVAAALRENLRKRKEQQLVKKQDEGQ